MTDTADLTRLAHIVVQLSDARVAFRSLVGADRYEERMKTPREIIRGAMAKHECVEVVALTHVLTELKRVAPEDSKTAMSLMAATLDLMEAPHA